MEGGIAAMKFFLAAKKVPTASCAQTNDCDWRAAQALPSRSACAGRFFCDRFDNIHIAEVTIPPLTTVEMSRLDLARAAVTALRNKWSQLATLRRKVNSAFGRIWFVRGVDEFPREER